MRGGGGWGGAPAAPEVAARAAGSCLCPPWKHPSEELAPSIRRKPVGRRPRSSAGTPPIPPAPPHPPLPPNPGAETIGGSIRASPAAVGSHSAHATHSAGTVACAAAVSSCVRARSARSIAVVIGAGGGSDSGHCADPVSAHAHARIKQLIQSLRQTIVAPVAHGSRRRCRPRRRRRLAGMSNFTIHSSMVSNTPGLGATAISRLMRSTARKCTVLVLLSSEMALRTLSRSFCTSEGLARSRAGTNARAGW